MAVEHPELLARVRDGLRALYGPRLAKLVLYGSRARGDAGPESDYDLAVFLADMDSTWEEIGRINRITEPILMETGVEIAALPFPADDWPMRTMLMHEIRKDGVEL